MVSKLFVVRNLLSGLVDQSYVVCNEAVASVELCVPYARRSPLDEWQLVLVGEINLDTAQIVSTAHVIVPWDTRRLGSASAVPAAQSPVAEFPVAESPAAVSLVAK